jgi:alkylation response protein AidB-like acyl-CoA dehydrogenase
VDFRDTPEQATFRQEVRAWLDEHLPEELRGHRGGGARFDGPEIRRWSRALHDGGWVGISWPAEYGGRGLSPRFQSIYLEEEARAEAPPHIGVIGLGMAGPTIISRGTDEQKAR